MEVGSVDTRARPYCLVDILMNKTLEIIKWLGTVLLIVGIYFTSRNVYPLGPIIQISGGFAWLAAAFWMKDKPLIATNLIMSIVGLSGLWPVFFG
jgi:hypothetical protein